MIFPYTLVDLTHTLDETIPTWNGKCGFSSDVIVSYEACTTPVKFKVLKHQMNAGIGTHMDAPSHCIPGTATIDTISLQELCMPLFIIDVSSKIHERYTASLEDIVAFEQQYKADFKKSCVIIKTGWAKFWNNPLHYRNNLVFPSVSAEAATYLIEKGIHALGIDTLSSDRPEDGFVVHKIVLGNSKLLIENVAHLDAMPAAGAFIIAAPLKIKEGTEAPIRLIGLTPSNN